ncbi:MAG: pyridoxal-phosphate dependent enzyme [Candidatus Absconditabacteria bacterium]|nr:pyridoxal-phosphate dependent enzyme [Candidatus Absconditabacteria bacterium]MDD3868101.1 pyridoxal-phosphate dependent enzyme [Candidatus Absconditabacteria bacterium]
MICPNPNDPHSGIQKAKHLGEQKRYYNSGQYDNPLNPDAHYKITGPQIYQQLAGDIQMFVTGLGTTGSMIGISKYLKEQDSDIFCLGVTRKPNNPVPGPRTKNLLQQISFSWEKYLDEMIDIGSREAYTTSLSLIREGLIAGPSSGFSLAAILSYLKQCKKKGTLDALRNTNGEIRIVFLCCDTPFPYIDEYFSYVPQHYFPKIQGEELLQQGSTTSFSPSYNKIQEISCKQLYRKAFSHKELLKDWRIYDIRDQEAYEHFHIPGAVHVENEEIARKYCKLHTSGCTCIVCKYGLRSSDFVSTLDQENLLSLIGGTTERSALDLPRWISPTCRRSHTTL